mmetsp:Transcript_86888/g.245035  ORF Transcript_86888/g.245035 Transcript_86888/m.245035 type:complete len:86 (-) Transcript_86888:519-776(-)
MRRPFESYRLSAADLSEPLAVCTSLRSLRLNEPPVSAGARAEKAAGGGSRSTCGRPGDSDRHGDTEHGPMSLVPLSTSCKSRRSL